MGSINETETNGKFTVKLNTMDLVNEAETKGKFAIKEVETREEMDKIMDVIWVANYDPYEPFAQLFFPVLGYTKADREAAIAESKERFWSDHKSQIPSHWFYVQDTETKEVIGCLQWEVEESNPFPDGPPKLTAPWWPDGEHREFTERILNQLYAPRANSMTRRNIGMLLYSTFFHDAQFRHHPFLFWLSSLDCPIRSLSVRSGVIHSIN